MVEFTFELRTCLINMIEPVVFLFKCTRAGTNIAILSSLMYIHTCIDKKVLRNACFLSVSL